MRLIVVSSGTTIATVVGALGLQSACEASAALVRAVVGLATLLGVA